MRAAGRRGQIGTLLLALCLASGGCVYQGGPSDPMEGPGHPLGITALRIPFEKLVKPVPPPGGFSSTYQKMLLDHQRLAQKKTQPDAQAKTESATAKDKTGSPGNSSPPPA
jgi:hypothetical protein